MLGPSPVLDVDPEAALPAVSIIVPTYQRRHELDAALSCVRAQTFRDWELIMVDDGSTDETGAWLATHAASHTVVTLPHNVGAAAARNAGIARARAPLIAFLDVDDRWRPDYLARQVGALSDAPDAVASCSDLIVVLSDGRRRRRRFQPPSGDRDDAVAGLLVDNPVGTLSSIVVRAADLRAVGGFAPELTVTHDRELYRRLLPRGPFARVAEPVLDKRCAPDSLTRDLDRWHADLLRFLRGFFADPANAAHTSLEWRVYRTVGRQLRARRRARLRKAPSWSSRVGLVKDTGLTGWLTGRALARRLADKTLEALHRRRR